MTGYLTFANQRDLERRHLLRTLANYGPMPAKRVREVANTECDEEIFDALPEISPQAITPRLNSLSLDGLVDGKLEVVGQPVVWHLTEKGRAMAHEEI